MPTKRTKIGPRKVNRDVPEWVPRYLETGETPAMDTAEHDQWIGWYFFGAAVPGLPDAHSEAGERIRFRR